MKNFYSSLTQKKTIEGTDDYNKKPLKYPVPQNLKLDLDMIINKPVPISAFTWSSADQNGSIIKYLTLPQDIYSIGIFSIMTNAEFYRYKAKLNIQVSGTSMHQGALIAAAVPGGYKPQQSVNQLLPAPHVFVYANEQTPVELNIPFYSNESLLRTVDNKSLVPNSPITSASIIIAVLNNLEMSGSASTSLTVSISLVLTEAEFYVPRQPSIKWADNPPTKFTDIGFKPQSLKEISMIPTRILDNIASGTKTITGDIIDIGRKFIKNYTGFHYPNETGISHKQLFTRRDNFNVTDIPTFGELLDDKALFNRTQKDYNFNTEVDEMDLSYILSKPVYFGTIKVNSDDNIGTLLCNYPITPYVEAGAISFYSPMRVIYESSRAWSGGLKLHIQAIMTNFHFCKLAIVRNYTPDSQTFTKYAPLESLANNLVDIIEFSGGGQIQTIDLPFCSQQHMLNCTKYLEANALLHGRFSIYLFQPLVISGTVPTSVHFNLYLSGGEDLTFYGTSGDPLRVFRIDGAESGAMSSDDKSQTSEENNTEPQISFKPQSQVIISTSDQHSLQATSEDQSKEDKFSDLFAPNYSIRDYVRRKTQLAKTDSTGNLQITFNLSDLIQGKFAYSAGMIPRFVSMYFAGDIGFKFQLYVEGASTATVRYIQPDAFRSNDVSIIDSISAVNPIQTPLVTGSGYISTAVDDSFGPVANFTHMLPVSQAPTLSGPSGISTCVFDFVIPNKNPNRILNFGAMTNPRVVPSFCDALGYLVISPSALSTQKLTVSLFASLTDESRLGFQVTPKIYQSCMVEAAPDKNRLSNYADFETPLHVNITDNIKAAYFFKVT